MSCGWLCTWRQLDLQCVDTVVIGICRHEACLQGHLLEIQIDHRWFYCLKLYLLLSQALTPKSSRRDFIKTTPRGFLSRHSHVKKEMPRKSLWCDFLFLDTLPLGWSLGDLAATPALFSTPRCRDSFESVINLQQLLSIIIKYYKHSEATKSIKPSKVLFTMPWFRCAAGQRSLHSLWRFPWKKGGDGSLGNCVVSLGASTGRSGK